MRKLVLFIAALFPFLVSAQAIGTDFESLPLSKADTFYVNYSASGTDVGFTVNTIHFPCVYDTSYGGYWSSGFAYSNMTDSVTSGYTNQYSAKAGSGANGSQKYAVSYGVLNTIRYQNFSPVSYSTISVTNSTYAYNSMKNGDAFGKKFGGATGNDSDWFKIIFRPYRNGVLQSDSVEFYLADFRFANNAQDYIVKDWRQVNLLPIILHSDSLRFELKSSDNGQFGMNTPAYFCLDNFGIYYEGVANVPLETIARIFPNPATDKIFVELKDPTINSVTLADVTGKTIAKYGNNGGDLTIDLNGLQPGYYFLQLEGKNGKAASKFLKQ